MTENSGKDSAPSTPQAKPVRVVGSDPAAPKTSESSVARPAPSSAAPSAAKPAVAKPAAAATPSGAGGGAAAAAKKASPVTKAAPAKKAAPATQPVPVAKKSGAAPVAPAPAQATAADETAVRPSFGERFKTGLDKASAKASATAEAAKAKAKAGRDVAAAERTATVPVGAPAAAVTAPGVAGAREPRHARLRLSRIDPWSVARVSFLLSVAFGIVLVVATTIIMIVLGAAGVWDAINSVVASVASSSDGSSSFDIRDYVGTGRVLGLTLVVSVVNVVLLTAMATLGAYLYNMAAALLGGIDVTLSEEQD